MKTKIYKSRFAILAFVISMLLFYASLIPSVKYTFFTINIICAVLLVNSLNKT